MESESPSTRPNHEPSESVFTDVDILIFQRALNFCFLKVMKAWFSCLSDCLLTYFLYDERARLQITSE